MQTIHSRTYTNVALTVLILMALVLLVRPYVSLPKANAASEDQAARPSRSVLLDPNAAVADGLRDIASANKEIAAATREAAKAQAEVAKAIGRLSESATK